MQRIKTPNVAFIEPVTVVKGNNLQGICCYEQQSSYLMGALAALMTRTNKIAFVGGVDNSRHQPLLRRL